MTTEIPDDVDQSTSSVHFDIDKWIELSKKCDYLPESDFRTLCEINKRILMREPNIVEVESPVTIVGDVHGQFYDMEEIFRLCGEPPETSYLFLGDFVDRGHYSLETIQRLLAFKAKYPKHITLIRGNHESRSISTQYGFYTECENKYGSCMPWRILMQTFDLLPIAALVDNEIFCVHGGLSPDIRLFNQIYTIDRNRDVPQNGPFCDLLWSDPDESLNESKWGISTRGAGYCFGRKTTEKFLSDNEFTMIARAHQLVQEGIQFMWDRKLVTVWSAPNYCYRCGNKASVLRIGPDSQEEVIFDAVPDDKRRVPDANPSPYFL